jgi:hydroxyacylglutathione hydrolase
MVTVANDAGVSIEKMELGPYGTNTYLVVCKKTGESLVVDAPARPATIVRNLVNTKPRYILLTHDHYDHTGALAELRSRLNIPLAAHIEDSRSLKTPPEVLLKDHDTVSLGDIKIEVIHTPGHTPGSLCFRIGRYLIAGDTIFPGGPGKTWSPDDFRQIIESITARILTLPERTRIFPGHGKNTTVKKSKEEYADFSSRPHPADLYGDVLWSS